MATNQVSADLSAQLHELLATSDPSSLLEKLRQQSFALVEHEDKKSTVSDYTWVTDDNISTASGTCLRRLLWPDGTSYEGGINANQKPDGHGELKSASGDHYVGEWLDGQLHGFGQYTLADGGTYRGQIADNKKEGFGKLDCRRGLTYEGEWHKDKPHGEGRLVHDDIVFCGRWVNGRIEGRGVYESPLWGRYVGDWKGDKKDGVGKVTYLSGASYDGRWEADLAHGLGRYRWPNGSTYDGSFHRGQLQGRGRFTSADGREIFIGSWFQNKKSGTGEMKFSDGAVYSGEWVADRPQGKGTFINPYGVMFRGLWHEGLFVADDSGGARGGLPICIVEGSSYQLQEDLIMNGSSSENPYALIDARVVLPAVPPGHDLTSKQVPRPRRFDQMLKDYSVESSSTFLSAVQPVARSSPPCFDTGYAYHTRFEIEYWPHNPVPVLETSMSAAQTTNVAKSGVYTAHGTTILPPESDLEDPASLYASTPTAQEMYSAQACHPQDIYTAATPTVHETVFVEACKPNQRQKFYATDLVQHLSHQPPSRPTTPMDTCRVDLVNVSRKTTGTINPACSRQTTGGGIIFMDETRSESPPRATSSQWRMTSQEGSPALVHLDERPHSVSTTDTVVLRNLPVPVEVAVTTELKFPKIRTHRTQVPFPVYAPRIREVPIPLESLTPEGVRMCEHIAEQVAMLRHAATNHEEFYLTGCQLDCFVEDITSYLADNAVHLAPKKQPSLCDFLL